VEPSSGAVVEEIEPEQLPLLMVIYGAGFVAVQLIFLVLYLSAYARRDALGLEAHEISVTREEMQNFLLCAGVGLTSIVIAVLGGQDAATLAGYTYLLLIPLLAANGYLMARRRKRSQSTGQ
jgi:hypothetical protein